MDEGDKDVNTGGFCSHGVKDDDDRRSESSCDSNDILLSNLADDATYSSPCSSSLPSFDMSSLSVSLEAKIPVKRGLSRFYEGKSKSFRCLSEVRCIEDLAKQETPSGKRLKASGECDQFDSTQNRCNEPIFNGRTISKKTTSKGSSVLWQARRKRNAGLPSSTKNAKPASAREPAVLKMDNTNVEIDNDEIKSKDKDVLIVCLYVDDLIFTGSNPSMFGECKEAMTKEFEMTDIGLMAYYLGIEVNQREDGSFISQAGYASEILKKFRMDNSKSINTPVECGVKLSKHDEEEKVDPTFFKSLVGSLRYLTCTRPDILYAVGIVSRYMEDPTTTHLKIAKRILRYIKGTIDFELLYSTSNHFKLEGYSDSDWGGDIDDRKSTTGFVFFMGDTTSTWISKKQPIVTLSTCEGEYVAATSCVCLLFGSEIY
ncbi:hypothetical protein ZIOFF_035267 [Zingiber officinale]|uniref:Reverse transcriptase Ty1/copia-type domain-containing protein n=1 Tax=Zingiber officinale TaxID=94328 RepID=A0A8J5GK34_ZINOF|nr:hypothetical protein ZIOFF_035267 [Zingiber officinale]